MSNADQDEEHAIAQQEEVDSMDAIFADDFTIIIADPGCISYSIRLRPQPQSAQEDDGFNEQANETDNHGNILLSRRTIDSLSLVVTYPPMYPDEIPTFGIAYLYNGSNSNGSQKLHAVQEQAFLNAILNTAQSELGMPCIYSCIQSANQFLANGGLEQAGLCLLSDDCLAHILSFVATSKHDIDNICTALPIFEGASKTNIVWKQLCSLHWKTKWGYKARWQKALSNFDLYNQQYYWLETYNNQQTDSQRTTLSQEELSSMVFDYRQWFSFRRFRQQPDNMRDVLPTGLHDSIACDVKFCNDRRLSSEKVFIQRCCWEVKTASVSPYEGINELGLYARSGSSIETLTVRRLASWGWELRGADYVFRAIDDIVDDSDDNHKNIIEGTDGSTKEDKLWEDLTCNLVVQEMPEWLQPQRGANTQQYYNYREVPDDPDCMSLLDW